MGRYRDRKKNCVCFRPNRPQDRACHPPRPIQVLTLAGQRTAATRGKGSRGGASTRGERRRFPFAPQISPEAKPEAEEGGRRSRAAGAGAGAGGREDEDVRPVAGLLPPGVEAQLALPHGVRHHRIPHHQDDGQLHRGGPQELQVRPGAQEALTDQVSPPDPSASRSRPRSC